MVVGCTHKIRHARSKHFLTTWGWFYILSLNTVDMADVITNNIYITYTVYTHLENTEEYSISIHMKLCFCPHDDIRSPCTSV